MIHSFLIVFAISLIANIYVIVFGCKDVNSLKERLSMGKYLAIVNKSMVENLGDKGATAAKLGCVVLVGIFILFNVWSFVGALVGLFAGMVAAKRLYQVPAVSNVVNKIATYVNRMR